MGNRPENHVMRSPDRGAGPVVQSPGLGSLGGLQGSMAHAKQTDDLDRWVQFCNNTEAWDKAWKVVHSGLRTCVNIAPTPELSRTFDFWWQSVLDARKFSWMGKWVKEIQGARAALRAPGDKRLVRLRAAIR